MRILGISAAAAMVLLTGCVTGYELQSSEVVSRTDDGATISQYEYWDPWTGDSYIEWELHNPTGYHYCGQIDGNISSSGGYSYGGVHLVAPYSSKSLAWVGTGGSVSITGGMAKLWTADGTYCGSFPD